VWIEFRSPSSLLERLVMERRALIATTHKCETPFSTKKATLLWLILARLLAAQNSGSINCTVSMQHGVPIMISPSNNQPHQWPLRFITIGIQRVTPRHRKLFRLFGACTFYMVTWYTMWPKRICQPFKLHALSPHGLWSHEVMYSCIFRYRGLQVVQSKLDDSHYNCIFWFKSP